MEKGSSQCKKLTKFRELTQSQSGKTVCIVNFYSGNVAASNLFAVAVLQIVVNICLACHDISANTI